MKISCQLEPPVRKRIRICNHRTYDASNLYTNHSYRIYHVQKLSFISQLVLFPNKDSKLEKSDKLCLS